VRESSPARAVSSVAEGLGQTSREKPVSSQRAASSYWQMSGGCEGRQAVSVRRPRVCRQRERDAPESRYSLEAQERAGAARAREAKPASARIAHWSLMVDACRSLREWQRPGEGEGQARSGSRGLKAWAGPPDALSRGDRPPQRSLPVSRGCTLVATLVKCTSSPRRRQLDRSGRFRSGRRDSSPRETQDARARGAARGVA